MQIIIIISKECEDGSNVNSGRLAGQNADKVAEFNNIPYCL